MKGQHWACLGSQGEPQPRLVRLLRSGAPQFVRFPPALKPHGWGPGDRLNVQLLRPRRNAVDQKAPEPFAPNSHRVPNAPPRHPLYTHAGNQRPSVISEARWREALDEQASTALALMVLLAVVTVSSALLLG